MPEPPDFHDYPLDGIVLRTHPLIVDVHDLVANERSLHLGPKEDVELQRQIEVDGGISRALLVEPHPNLPAKYRIIDGERRWSNSLALVEQGKARYARVPVEVTDRTLSDEERFRAWIALNRNHHEWLANQEMIAYHVQELIGPNGAATSLGLTARKLRQLVEVFKLSLRFTNLRDPATAITWARELHGINKKLLTPSVVDAVAEKVSQKRITNSKDLRKLRYILKDPVARDHFLSQEGDIDSAMLRVAPQARNNKSLINELDASMEAIRRIPWTALEELKGDSQVIRLIDDALKLLKRLRKALS